MPSLQRVTNVTDFPTSSAGTSQSLPDERRKDTDPNDELRLDLKSLPPVSTVAALLLILVHNLAEWWGITSETQVSVSWTKVVMERNIWRIFVAHFFHFNRVNFIINLTSLMALGRYLERKIRPIPMFILLQLMGMIGSFFHMIISTWLCKNSPDCSTYGFSHVVLALKMVQVLSKDAGQRRGPTLLFGILPVYLGAIAPWEPLFESILSDVLVKGKNFATHFSGLMAGLCFPLIDYYFHDLILVPSKISLTFPEPGGTEEVTEVGSDLGLGSRTKTEDLGRCMMLIKEDESSRVKLFHELPSDECITLFRRRQPMNSNSLHYKQYASKSDSYLLFPEN